jgi:hypothetical protein
VLKGDNSALVSFIRHANSRDSKNGALFAKRLKAKVISLYIDSNRELNQQLNLQRTFEHKSHTMRRNNDERFGGK